MEDLTLSSSDSSPPPFAIPEALQFPTRPVSTGFLLQLTRTNVVFFFVLAAIALLNIPTS